MKTDAERLTDTKNYLSNHITPAQFNEVVNLFTAAPNKPAIFAALSIGHSNPLNKGGRRAKRCLMLLASLLIDDNALRAGEVNRIKNLPEGSEPPLIAEIKSWFTLAGITPAIVAMNAVNNIGKMPKWNNVNYEATDAIRGVYHKDKAFNCYNGCVFWAFQAGAISKRYLWNNLQGKDGNAFFPIYSQVGWTKIIEYGPTRNLLRDDSAGGDVIAPAGRTIYFQTPTKVFGHVACSLGDGRVISQNSVNIGDTALGLLVGAVKVEFEKMANAVTHIVSIRDMLTQYFNPDHGYQSLQVSNGAFWDPIPVDER
jgi:cell wall-associated NlpC family hydrolase